MIKITRKSLCFSVFTNTKYRKKEKRKAKAREHVTLSAQRFQRWARWQCLRRVDFPPQGQRFRPYYISTAVQQNTTPLAAENHLSAASDTQWDGVLCSGSPSFLEALGKKTRPLSFRLMAGCGSLQAGSPSIPPHSQVHSYSQSLLSSLPPARESALLLRAPVIPFIQHNILGMMPHHKHRVWASGWGILERVLTRPPDTYLVLSTLLNATAGLTPSQTSR